MIFCVLRGRRAGFTLIEIMIVIAIIAILAGIVVPNIAMARFEAGVTACQENCKIGMEAVQMALVRKPLRQFARDILRCNNVMDIDGYSDGTMWFSQDLSQLVDAGYLEKTLHCPVRGGYEVYYDDHANEVVSLDFSGERVFSLERTFCVICSDWHKNGEIRFEPGYDMYVGAILFQ